LSIPADTQFVCLFVCSRQCMWDVGVGCWVWDVGVLE
jgi:hypothetical protein